MRRALTDTNNRSEHIILDKAGMQALEAQAEAIANLDPKRITTKTVMEMMGCDLIEAQEILKIMLKDGDITFDPTTWAYSYTK